MKWLDKLALKIFSILILAIAVVVVLVITGIIPYADLGACLIKITDNDMGIKIAAGVLGVLVLLAIKGFFFTSKPEDNGKDGIILENASGKLVISKESLENLIASVIKDIPGADTVSSRTIWDKDRNLIVYVTAVVSKDVMLKDISNELQTKIKDLTEFKEAGNMDDYAILAHALKTEARYVGCAKLGDIAYEHELAGKANDQNKVNEKFEEFKNEANRVHGIVKRYFGA